jgi:phospholipid/cholesterol/gamma-HCH transport system permease protein
MVATTQRAILNSPAKIIASLGRHLRTQISSLGAFAHLLGSILAHSGIVFKRPGLISQQVHFIGNYSLLIIAVSGLFVGFVLGLQGYNTLNRYGSEEALGLLVALSLTRELGPVITALLFAGRAGTSLTAEIGLMKAGEQIAAMEVMAVDPIRRVVVPRFWGGVIAMPILATVFSAVGIIGGWIVGVLMIGIDPGTFWSQMQNGVDVFQDIGNGVVKSIVFGIAVTLIALYEGWNAKPTPEGVSRATTRTVVSGALVVLGLDFLLTALMFSN